ncbi:hypothetical protein ACWGMW_16285 [Streptomyces albidoflavus]
MIGLRFSTAPSPAADAAHDAAHETAARFRHGVYSVPCETCHVSAGFQCLARRSVHPARRQKYQREAKHAGLLPLLTARGR